MKASFNNNCILNISIKELIAEVSTKIRYLIEYYFINWNVLYILPKLNLTPGRVIGDKMVVIVNDTETKIG